MAAILCPSIGEWTDDLWLIHTTERVMAVTMNALQRYSATWVDRTNKSTCAAGKCTVQFCSSEVQRHAKLYCSGLRPSVRKLYRKGQRNDKYKIQGSYYLQMGGRGRAGGGNTGEASGICHVSSSKLNVDT